MISFETIIDMESEFCDKNNIVLIQYDRTPDDDGWEVSYWKQYNGELMRTEETAKAKELKTAILSAITGRN